jgi:hypothetical protein
MILHIHSDASYLSVSKARSRVGGYFYLSNNVSDLPDAPPPPLNGPIHVNSTVLKSVLASAAEAEVGGLFYNAKDGVMFRTMLTEMGHSQPATPLQTDNACAAGIANKSIKQRRSKAIDMRFYWIQDRVSNGEFRVYWQRGIENLADYFTKHHSPSHHRRHRNTYLSPHQATSDFQRGCVDPAPRSPGLTPAQPTESLLLQASSEAFSVPLSTVPEAVVPSNHQYTTYTQSPIHGNGFFPLSYQQHLVSS